MLSSIWSWQWQIVYSQWLDPNLWISGLIRMLVYAESLISLSAWTVPSQITSYALQIEQWFKTTHRIIDYDLWMPDNMHSMILILISVVRSSHPLLIVSDNRIPCRQKINHSTIKLLTWTCNWRWFGSSIIHDTKET